MTLMKSGSDGACSNEARVQKAVSQAESASSAIDGDLGAEALSLRPIGGYKATPFPFQQHLLACQECENQVPLTFETVKGETIA